jgi:hypothetical protein
MNTVYHGKVHVPVPDKVHVYVEEADTPIAVRFRSPTSY